MNEHLIETMNGEYGPAHVERLNSIEKLGLAVQKFEGSDASLATSLFEYGLAWRQLSEAERLQMDKEAAPNQEEWLFVYSIGNGRFDRASIAKCDPEKEWDWVDWSSFLASLDMTREEWIKLPFPRQVYYLFIDYGYENIFGSSYWEGFAIEND